jgi:hypothetical protein
LFIEGWHIAKNTGSALKKEKYTNYFSANTIDKAKQLLIRVL